MRAVSRIEGWSFLVLLCIAMPLKYVYAMPMAVKIVGWAHGVLFVALCALLFGAWTSGKLSFGRSAMVFMAALLPFGPFVLDKHLRQWEKVGQ